MSGSVLMVIVYDISSDKRRAKLHALLRQYGVPVQRSAFEARLTAREREQLLRRVALLDLVDAATDRLIIYPVPHDEEAQVASIGQPRPAIVESSYFLV